jgi:adenylate kinase family enzyme
VVKERIKTYDEWTRPVLAFYQDRKYHQIRGDRSPGYIFEEISGILEPVVSKNGSSCCKKPQRPLQ